jgi:hypothetical protein
VSTRSWQDAVWQDAVWQDAVLQYTSLLQIAIYMVSIISLGASHSSSLMLSTRQSVKPTPCIQHVDICSQYFSRTCSDHALGFLADKSLASNPYITASYHPSMQRPSTLGQIRNSLSNAAPPPLLSQ